MGVVDPKKLFATEDRLSETPFMTRNIYLHGSTSIPGSCSTSSHVSFLSRHSC